MGRIARAIQPGHCYHVLNRGNGRACVFRKDEDYAAFIELMRQAGEVYRYEDELSLGSAPAIGHAHRVPSDDGR